STAAECVGKIGPRNQGGEIEDRIRQPLGGQLSQPAEENCEDPHGHERLNNYPEDADKGLLVAHLYITPDEEIKEVTMGPEFAQVEVKQAPRRLNAHAHDAAGQRSGWGCNRWIGSHRRHKGQSSSVTFDARHRITERNKDKGLTARLGKPSFDSMSSY